MPFGWSTCPFFLCCCCFIRVDFWVQHVKKTENYFWGNEFTEVLGEQYRLTEEATYLFCACLFRHMQQQIERMSMDGDL